MASSGNPIGMYSTKRAHDKMVENNMYLCIGDKYVDPPRNMFRQKPKGQAEPKPFNIKVDELLIDMLLMPF